MTELKTVYNNQVKKGYIGTFEVWCKEIIGIEPPQDTHEKQTDIKDVKKALNRLIKIKTNFEVEVSVWDYDNQYDVVVTITEDGEIIEEFTTDTYNNDKKATTRRKAVVRSLAAYKAEENENIMND